ncbi:hypothetical protein ALQ18_01181 [Pseudomonas marginalis pv. marginalis]|nr:hypothetical protein ALQ18_01181 [Pseudomonas marginalis pv. marginalis]
MNKLLMSASLVWSVVALAENRIYDLHPAFNDALKAEFTQVMGSDGETVSAVLVDKNGNRFNLPDTCEPEGGDAVLKDAFIVNAKKAYFLFTCAWPVRHPGLGLNGTQYETFVYEGDTLSLLKKNVALSQALSGYEGSLEEGGISYAWYLPRQIVSQKVTELELGNPTDSLGLAHHVVLARLKDKDYAGVKAYLAPDRLDRLNKDFPVNTSNCIIYNDFGYALAQAGDNTLAYKLLKAVESVSPDRIVLKLNIADVLWSSDKSASRIYYKKYGESMRQAGKEKLIPSRVVDRINSI